MDPCWGSRSIVPGSRRPSLRLNSALLVCSIPLVILSSVLPACTFRMLELVIKAGASHDAFHSDYDS